MSLFKRVRKEFLNDNGIAVIYSKFYFLNILIYEDKCESTASNILNQFLSFNIEQTQQPTGLYDATEIGFKRE